MELTYSGGAPYGSHCGKAGRVSRIFFFCDSAAGDVSGCCMWDIWLVCSLSNSVIRTCCSNNAFETDVKLGSIKNGPLLALPTNIANHVLA